MPDKYDFDHLGESAVVRCIWCGKKERDEEKRAAHFRKHTKDREAAKLASLEERLTAARVLD